MSIDAVSESDAWRALEPHAQLVQALLPNSTSLHVFDDEGWLRWSTEAMTGPDLPSLVQGSLLEARNRTRAQGRKLQLEGDPTPIYVWWLRDETSALVASVAITMRASADDESRTFESVHAIVKPAMECMRMHLLAQGSILQLHRSLTSRDKDVELLLSGGDHSPDERGYEVDGLKSLLLRAASLMGCEVAALVVPERNISLVVDAAGSAIDEGLLNGVQRHLLEIVQTRRESVFVNGLEGTFQMLPYRILCAPVKHPSGRVAGVIAVFRGLGAPEFQAKEARLVELLARRVWLNVESAYDALTGLLTRPALEQIVRSRMAEPDAPKDWSTLYVDCDQLHLINEKLGMHTGDAALAQVGELLRTRLPNGAFSARVSGDRFVVVIPLGIFQASEVGERVRLIATQLEAIQAGASLPITLTIGVAQIGSGDEAAFAQSLALAETACKTGKDHGRNRVELHEDVSLSAIRRITAASTIADSRKILAAQTRRLDALLMQPLGSGAGLVPHYEILLRMIGPEGETLGPDRFMSAAQGFDMMPAIDRWVFERTMTLLQPHTQLLSARSVVFSINLSGQSIEDTSFHDFLLDGLKRCGLDPRALCFEIKESDAVAHPARTELLAGRLRRAGCGVALDDVCMGLGSLGQLRSLPITLLKFDGSFIRDILRDPRSESMVQAVTQLAHTMSIETVAEHVESEEIRRRLESLGVDYGQGFAIARPVALERVLEGLPLLAGATPTSRLGIPDEGGGEASPTAADALQSA